MNAERFRKLFGIVLFVFLFVGLVVFCVIYVSHVTKWEHGEIHTHKHDHTHAHQSPDYNDTHLHELSATDEHSADHDDDAWSTSGPFSTTISSTTIQSDGTEYSIKLNEAGNSSSGRVYIEYNGTTGFVCNDGFDDHAATVACRELGYKNGLTYNFKASGYKSYTNLLPSVSGLRCIGRELKLKDCEGFRLGNVTSCTWFASALCYNEEPYQLRLVGGVHNNSGMVEIKIDGQWGIFCGIRDFDDEVADVLCRNMNFIGGITVPRGNLGTANQSKVWVPYIYCNEEKVVFKSIFQCSIILHVDNILTDLHDFRNNKYRNEYMACLDKPNSFAVSVQCLI